ncbi:sterol carrier family protein [Corynebacterium sp. H128]|uniref:sterol carrier family protein n=1 Tax=Corynebacterium sp. H128 TaxID=3133427 RepID=UPI00403F0036
MLKRSAPEPGGTREAVQRVRAWIDDPDMQPLPSRAELALAVRLTARTLEHLAPGHSVEVRVPPFVAVQCIAGPRHTRGTPPNVVEMRPEIWLRLAAGAVTFEQALSDGHIEASGTRANEISHWLPLV